jgi:DUF4097 and DUF4098 domain-containing protein YvlB
MPSFETPTAITAIVEIPAGRIQLIAADRTDTTVEVLPTDPTKSRDVKVAEQTRVEFADGVLRVETAAKNQLFGPSGTVEVTVQLPAGSRVDAKAAGADFRAVGRFGDVAFEGAQATIKVDEAAGVRVTVSVGDVTIGRLTGPAAINTVKGDIRITEAVSGTAVLTTQAGEIAVDAAAGVSATLDAGTTYGRVHNALKNTEGADAPLHIHATTAYGDIVARGL